MNFEKKLFYFDGCAIYQKHAHHFHYYSLKTLQTITNNAPTNALLTHCHITTTITEDKNTKLS